MPLFYVLIFIVSACLLAAAGGLVVESLIRIAKYFNLREFVVGFIIMSLVASAPNLFVGINAALRGIPELSFGDVVGGNVVDLTLGMALGILIGKEIIADSRLVQASSFFTAAIALLPLILVLDGELGRLDGLILLSAFFVYVFWVFSKEERFKKIYQEGKKESKRYLLKSLLLLHLGLFLLIIGSQGVVNSAIFFGETLGLPLGLVGILIVGLGNCLPEIYFTIASARKGQGWLILGDMMGGVIACASLVLGIVVLIHPLKISNFSPYFLARIFLLLAVVFFSIFLHTGKKLTLKEGLILLGTYISFLLSEIFLG